MKVEYNNNKYLDGKSKMKPIPEFENLLYRQDWGGSESVFFNDNEMDKVIEMIGNGDIIIHNNYSVLICRNNGDTLEEFKKIGICTITEEELNGRNNFESK